MTPVHDPRFSSRRWDHSIEHVRKESASAARRDYIIPLVMLLVGWLAMVAWPFAWRDVGLVEAVLGTGLWLLALVISVLIGLLGLVITCRLFGEDAGHLPLALVRLAGIYAVVMVVAALMSGLMCFGLIITFSIMAGLVAMIFQMELKAGVVVALVTWIVGFGVSLAITALFH